MFDSLDTIYVILVKLKVLRVSTLKATKSQLHMLSFPRYFRKKQEMNDHCES